MFCLSNYSNDFVLLTRCRSIVSFNSYVREVDTPICPETREQVTPAGTITSTDVFGSLVRLGKKVDSTLIRETARDRPLTTSARTVGLTLAKNELGGHKNSSIRIRARDSPFAASARTLG